MAQKAARRQRSVARRRWDGNISDLRKIGQGATAFVFIVDDRAVVKVPNGLPASEEAFERERDVYRTLQRSVKDRQQFVLACLDWGFSTGLVLERCVETLRSRLSRIYGHGVGCASAPGNYDLMDQAEKWALQAASGLDFIHRKGVIQADVGCHNMLLDEHDNLKIADFSGSVIQSAGDMEQSALVSYDVRSQLPYAKTASIETDLFALGSAVYEMVTGHLPLDEVPDRLVRQRFMRRQWPEMKQIRRANSRLSSTMMGCWEVRFTSAQKVVDHIEGASSRNLQRSTVVVPFPQKHRGHATQAQKWSGDGWMPPKQLPAPTSKNEQRPPKKRPQKISRDKDTKNSSIVHRWMSYFGGQ